MNAVRPPAVAGLFYPAQPAELRAAVRRHLAEGRSRARGGQPKALVVPHAGYVYSGSVAGSAYASIEPLRSTLRRVVLLGPAHRVPFRGFALSAADAFETPLGPVPVDHAAARRIEDLPEVRVFDAAHAEEHSLEVQLPFLQEILPAFELVPVAVGAATPEEVERVLERLDGGAETLLLVSTDLSHYHDYETARRLDRETTQAIEALQPEDVGEESACGRVPLRGLLRFAARRSLRPRTLDLRSSGDTAGPRERVVGYGAYAFS